jgi:LuxR family quorum-sensing system transcriptional regulator SolR
VLRFEDYVEKSQTATTVSELAKQYSEAIGANGYENCVVRSMRGRNVGHIAWFYFPDGYADAYIGRRWDRIDPVLFSSWRASRPFFWNDVVGQTKLSPEQRTFLEECKDLKVHSGIVYPFHGPGNRLDIVSISRRVSDLPDPASSSFLHAVSIQTWNRYLELSGEELFAQPEGPILTPRELEVLRWCKDGKSRPEIGDILSISHKTVEFHLCNIMNKLGATNQITAVVIGLQKGLIDL